MTQYKNKEKEWQMVINQERNEERKKNEWKKERKKKQKNKTS